MSDIDMYADYTASGHHFQPVCVATAVCFPHWYEIRRFPPRRRSKQKCRAGACPQPRTFSRPAGESRHARSRNSPLFPDLVITAIKGKTRTGVRGRNPGGGVNGASETRTLPPTNTPNLILWCAGCDRHGRLGSTAPLPVSPAIHSSIGDPSRLRTLARIDKLR